MMLSGRGVADAQVIQRTTATEADVWLTVAGHDSLHIVVTGPDGAVVATGAPDVGQDPFLARLRVPVGGPYAFLASSPAGQGAVLARDVYVGDVWVLAGQSNMVGGGVIRGSEQPAPGVHVMHADGSWGLATEPLHDMCGVVNPDQEFLAEAGERGAARLRAGTRGAGLGLPFGKCYLQVTGVPVGLIPAARGGASLLDWSPDAPAGEDSSLYPAMLSAVANAGGKIAGLLWYQGESEALGTGFGVLPHSRYGRSTQESSLSFASMFRDFVRRVRADLGAPELPFFHVQIGRFVDDAPPGVVAAWNTVREAQRRFEELGVSGAVTAIDMPVWDLVHLETDGLRRVGRRLARLASGAATSLRVVAVEVSTVELATLRVRYDGVVGPLAPSTHVGGFSVRDVFDREQPIIATADVDPDDPASVLVRLTVPSTPGDCLWYGWGLDPYCNLVDAEDMAAPAFGPWPLLSHG